MSTLLPERVYRGFWIDWSRGSTLGATVTTTSNTANIVVAILSVLIAFAGSHLWDIIAFCYSAKQAAGSLEDGIHHQRQLLLRNLASPAAVLFKVIQMRLRWGNRGLSPLKRLAPLLVVTALCSGGFIVAGVVSSLIVTNNDLRVLANAPTCGFDQFPESDIFTDTDRYHFLAWQLSAEYARTCYNGSTADPACQIFHTQSIPFETQYTPCPFETDHCVINGPRPALLMDTGPLWSNDVFGLNTNERNAVSFRRVTTCAPLNVSRYMTVTPVTDAIADANFHRKAFGGEEMAEWFMGPANRNNGNATLSRYSVLTTALVDYTFKVQKYSPAAGRYLGQSGWYPGVQWMPLSPFLASQSDLALASLSSNSVSYDGPVDDPFFAAHQKVYDLGNRLADQLPNVTHYLADNPAQFVGCTDKTQFCITGNKCTSLTYSFEAIEEALAMGLNAQQNVTVYSFANALVNHETLISGTDDGSGTGVPLLARQSFGYTQAALPSNQWELEVKYWQSIVLTAMQKFMSDVAAGQGLSDPTYDHLILTPPGPAERWLCGIQKMMAPNGFSNLSVFGLSFTVAFCSFFVLLNLLLSRTLRWYARRNGKSWLFLRQWDEDEVLQFHRTAYECSGLGPKWIDAGTHRIPVTADNQGFARLADCGKPIEPYSVQVSAAFTTTNMSADSLVKKPPAVMISICDLPRRSYTA